jgi:hypothetical protein
MLPSSRPPGSCPTRCADPRRHGAALTRCRRERDRRRLSRRGPSPPSSASACRRTTTRARPTADLVSAAVSGLTPAGGRAPPRRAPPPGHHRLLCRRAAGRAKAGPDAAPLRIASAERGSRGERRRRSRSAPPVALVEGAQGKGVSDVAARMGGCQRRAEHRWPPDRKVRRPGGASAGAAPAPPRSATAEHPLERLHQPPEPPLQERQPIVSPSCWRTAK